MSAAPKFDPKNMVFRNMGNTGLRVPVFSYGGWLTVGGTENGQIVTDLMRTAWEHGCNMFDNAETYANGNSEIEMGRAIKELGFKREDIIVTTKIFFGTGGTERHNGRGLSRKHIIEGVKASLERLQLHNVDIVFAHRPDRTTPMEETVRAFNYVLDKGWAYYWGTSEWSQMEIQQATEIARRLNMVAPSVEQPHYSMLHRERFEVEYGPLFQREKYGTTTWSPLESGLLTGKYNSGEVPAGSRYDTNKAFFSGAAAALKTPEGQEKIRKVKELTKIAEELGGSMTHLALAWVAKNENVSTCILGATKVEQLAENFKALEILPKLTSEVMERIEKILDNTPKPAETYGRTDPATGNLF